MIGSHIKTVPTNHTEKRELAKRIRTYVSPSAYRQAIPARISFAGLRMGFFITNDQKHDQPRSCTCSKLKCMHPLQDQCIYISPYNNIVLLMLLVRNLLLLQSTQYSTLSVWGRRALYSYTPAAHRHKRILASL